MAFIQSTSAPRLARGSVFSLFQASANSVFCYGAFALSVGFTVALVFGLVP
jgi:hypothetical protein